MTIRTVTSADGSPTSTNVNSLGYILAHSVNGDVINFASTINEIDLTATLTITKNVTIRGDRDGNGTPDVIIKGGAFNGPDFTIAAGAIVSIDGLTIENGAFQAAPGSAVGGGGVPYSATRGGAAAGGIMDYGSLTIGHSHLTGNRATGGKGGNGPFVTVGYNGAQGGNAAGGIYIAHGARLDLLRETNRFDGNIARGGKGGDGGRSPEYAGGAGGTGGYARDQIYTPAQNGGPGTFNSGSGGAGGNAFANYGGQGTIGHVGFINFTNSPAYDPAQATEFPLAIYTGPSDGYLVLVQPKPSGSPPVPMPSLTIVNLTTGGSQVFDFHDQDQHAFGFNFSDNLAPVQLFGYSYNDNIRGGHGNDTLDGSSGADTLNGAQGADSMTGGADNDLYFVDNALDKVVEANSQGADTVFTSVSYTLQADQSVDLLATTSQGGVAAINLAGNNLAQAIRGNSGNNGISGGGGADSLYGFGGDDRFYVGSSAERVFEVAGQGNDTVFASATYALQNGQSIEALATISQGATTAISLSGNNLAQTIRGNQGVNGLYGGDGNDTLYGFGGNDRLVGGNGHDVMDGGAGNDVFAYSAVIQSTGSNRDLIQNINLTAADKFQFTVKPTANIHAAVTHGTLNEGSFDTNLSTAIHDAITLGANQAVLFTPDGGNLAGHVFLIVDVNHTAGYQAGVDYVVELQNPAGALTLDDFI